MSQSRFSIVLVGVSALLRRPLVSRLRPADGERSSWVVFAARGGRFESGFRSASWFFRLPLRSGPRRVGLRAHCFRFSARADSEWLLGEFVLPPSASEIPLGGLAFGLTASAFRRAPIRGCPRRVGSSAGRVGLRAHCFRFSACTASEWPLGEFVLPPSALEIALGELVLPLSELAFGPPLPLFGTHRFGDCRWAGWPSDSLLPLFGTRRFGVAAGRVRSSAFRFGDCPRRVGLRAHRFRFSARTASELPSPDWPSGFRFGDCRRAGWSLGSLLPLFGMQRFGDCPRRVGLRAHCFRFSARTDSGVPSAGWFFRWAGWPSGSLLPLFGTHRFGNCPRRVGLRVHRFRFSACTDSHRRTAEARTDGAHRHDTCFTSKHLSQHVNLPHRTP